MLRNNFIARSLKPGLPGHSVGPNLSPREEREDAATTNAKDGWHTY